MQITSDQNINLRQIVFKPKSFSISIWFYLQLIHDTVIDTSVVFPHSRGPPYKKALRTLCGDILQKIIQNDGKFIYHSFLVDCYDYNLDF